jgi:hypothetical protein
MAFSFTFSLAFGSGPLTASAQENGAATTNAAPGTSTSMVLSGGVTHSDKLDPLPAEDRVGAVVNAGNNSGGSATPQIIQKSTSAPATASGARYPLPLPPVLTNPSRNQQPVRQTLRLTAQSAQSAQSGQSAQSAKTAAQIAAQYQAQIQAQQARAAQQAAARIPAYHPSGPSGQTGSPMAPQRQVLSASQSVNQSVNQSASPLQGRAAGGFQINDMLHSATPRLDSMSVYQKNLRAIASLDLNHSGRNAGLQAGLQAGGEQVKIEVPFWLAGEWVRSETNESSRIELPSGKALKAVGKQKAAVDDVFGTYKDKSGKVWMVVPLHNRGSVDRGFAVDRHQVNKYELILTGKTSALVKVTASHTVVDKATNKVIQAYQDEELNSYSLVQDGLVKTDSSVKVFDQMGAPKLLTHAVSMERRIHKL